MGINVAFVEDNRELLASLAALISHTPDLLCVATCADAEAALEQLPAARPDIVVMDIRLPGLSGVDCVRRLKPLLPEAEFLMLTVLEDYDQVYESLLAGATGYLLKRDLNEQLVHCIRDLHAGGSPMSSSIARKVVVAFAEMARSGRVPDSALSSREEEVLHLLARGRLYKEIADSLGLSYHTVRTHIHNIYRKLQVNSRREAARHPATRRSGQGDAPRHS